MASGILTALIYRQQSSDAWIAQTKTSWHRGLVFGKLPFHAMQCIEVTVYCGVWRYNGNIVIFIFSVGKLEFF